MRARRLGLGLAAALCASLLALAAGEAAIRLLGADWSMIAQILYYQRSDPGAHRVSEDPILHYELAPGGAAEGPHILPGRRYQVHVDRQGARGPQRGPPPEGARRVIFVGASTVYGQGVDDGETLPAQLEAWLDARHPDHPHRVANYGVSAYVPRQIGRLARRRLAAEPGLDLILLMFTNHGRRAFLEGVDPAALPGIFAADPSLWLENLPPPIPLMPPAWHEAGLRSLALYRLGAAWWRGTLGRGARALPVVMDEEIAELRRLMEEARAAGVPVVVVGYPVAPGASSLPWYVRAGQLEGAGIVDLGEEGEPPSHLIHPPPQALEAYAGMLGAALLRMALPCGPAPSAGEPTAPPYP